MSAPFYSIRVEDLELPECATCWLERQVTSMATKAVEVTIWVGGEGHIATIHSCDSCAAALAKDLEGLVFEYAEDSR